MQLLERIFPRTQSLAEETPGWNSIFTFLQNSLKSAAGVMVTGESALRQPTVYGCIRVLAETLAQLPLHIYRRTNSGMKDLAMEPPLNRVLSRFPNPWQTSFEFREMMMGHVCRRGNAYARIIPGELGAVTQLWPLHPDRMKVRILSNHNPLYVYTYPNGKQENFSQQEIFHLRGLSSDGYVGLSPLMLARDTIGNALAAERYQGKVFQNGARPSGYIKGPVAMKPADAKMGAANLHGSLQR